MNKRFYYIRIILELKLSNIEFYNYNLYNDAICPNNTGYYIEVHVITDNKMVSWGYIIIYNILIISVNDKVITLLSFTKRIIFLQRIVLSLALSFSFRPRDRKGRKLQLSRYQYGFDNAFTYFNIYVWVLVEDNLFE